MAAKPGTANVARNKQWYDEDLKEVNAPIRNLLETYSNIAPEQVVAHVNDIVSLIGSPIIKHREFPQSKTTPTVIFNFGRIRNIEFIPI